MRVAKTFVELTERSEGHYTLWVYIEGGETLTELKTTSFWRQVERVKAYPRRKKGVKLNVVLFTAK